MSVSQDFLISGVHIGEHSFEPSAVIQEIQSRCIDEGLNFVTIRTPNEWIPAEYFYEWAQFLRENRVYFIFLYTIQHAPRGHVSQFTPEIIARIKEIAGEYFIGDMIGEVGSENACKLPGYFDACPEKLPRQDAQDMKEAHDNYIREISRLVEIDRSLGVERVVTVEATVLNAYNMEAGVDIPMCEMMCGDPEIVISALRGTARAYKAPMWGTYIAHEWYGGIRHEDMLKQKRLLLAYRYAYMAGSNAFCLESGDEAIDSYDQTYPAEHAYCRHYRDALREMAQRIRCEERPAGGPKVKVAFVQGNYDAYGVWGASSVWSQFHRPEWAYGDAEQSWRIFGEIGTKRSWSDVANYGTQDYSALPAYGMYDILPATASAEVMAQYEYLIFVGWNTMTEAIYQNLEAYVEGGGKLLITAAHLNTNPVRGGEYVPIRGGDYTKLLGCILTGTEIATNNGVKFVRDSLIPDIQYPGTNGTMVDPLYSAGWVRYADAMLTTGTQAAYLSDTFYRDGDREDKSSAVIENRLGTGTVIFLTTMDYPGNGAVYPLYRALVREILTATHRTCGIKVYGSDRVRFAVYEGDKMYLLNTEYDTEAHVAIETPEKTMNVTLAPLELREIAL